ncbi:MAG: phycobilisome rod-core linker polypeptide [Cyanobacteria bacterium P01_F01_bin.150]
MAIPLLNYSFSSQNTRIPGYEVASDEQPRVWDTENLLSDSDINNLIEASYRQIYFHAFESDREPFLESQLRVGQITVREFIRGLLLSNTFNRSFYDLNSNYRFVEQCVQRVLGRDIYNEREKIAWSIVVATKGRAGFIDDLLNCEEYLENFGDTIVPYQRRRVLPGRDEGELPFNLKSPRYDKYHRDKLGFPKSGTAGFVPQELIPRSGDPALYLRLARKMKVPTLPVANVYSSDDYMSKVPYRSSK